MSKTINSRSKGRAGEQELANLLRETFGVKVTRNLVQSREGGCDLILAADTPDSPALAFLQRFAVEVKRYATARPCDIEQWWAQAVRQANDCEKLPMLAYRLNRQYWMVRIPLGALNPWFPFLETQHCTLPFDVFKFVVETLSTKPL